MIDIILDSEILSARSKINCIKFVAKNLGSENSELNAEAKRIRKNLEESIPKVEENIRNGKRYPILNKDFSPVNFRDYIERLKSEKDLVSIPDELKGPFYLAFDFQSY